MTRYARCPDCDALAAAPDGAAAFACPACGAEVAAPAGGPRRASVRHADPPDDSIPTLTPTATPARPSNAAAWRVGGLFTAALLTALGFTGHVVFRVLAPEAVADLPAVAAVAPVATPPPTNATRPAPKPRPTPRIAAPIELETPDPVATDWRREWRPVEPAGLRLRVSLPGERRRRAFDLAAADGSVVAAAEDSGAEGPAQYRVLALPSPDGPLTAATLPKLLASLRPDSLAPPSPVTVGPQEYVAWRFLAHDGTEWTVHALARAGKLVLLVRSLDATKAADFDAAAGLRRFLGSVELLRDD